MGKGVDNIIDKSRAVLVAISGGADSVCLLHKLVTEGYYCVAAHCNFHLRGAESDSDEAFVRSYCESLGVPLHVAQFDTKLYAREHGVSIEMAARDLRYEWFGRLLDENNIPVVAVAHHSDDAAETFFLNLSRGTGLRGLTGMKPSYGRIVRPMLGMSRQEVELYCRAHKLKYVNDSTNASDDFARNKIRHHIIPQFKELNPSFLATMRANMTHLSKIYDIFAQLVDDFVRKSVTEFDDQTLISMERLQQLPDAEPYLFEILQPKGFSSDSIHKIAHCVALSQWGRIFFASGRRAVVDRFNIIVQPWEDDVATGAYSIAYEQTEVFSPIHLTMSHINVGPDYVLSKQSDVAHIDASKLTFPLTLRHWQKGDTFRPLGMRGFKKLSDFFVDSKMSQPDKENTWIVVSGGEVVWVVGKRIDDRFKVSPGCKEVLEMRLDEN